MKPITLIIGVVLLIIAFFHKQLFSSVTTSTSGAAVPNGGTTPVDNFVPRPSGGFGNEYGIISPTDPLNNQNGLFKEVAVPLFSSI